jgi:indole-3-glycerol phosphate synthase
MNVLDRIIAYKREEVAARKKLHSWRDLTQEAVAHGPKRGFRNKLYDDDMGPRLIAEIKKASPSRGVIREDFDVPALARAYEDGGAACLSVLTDAPSFQGHEDFLVEARAASTLPVLRKDFMIDTWQIAESAAIGADAVLIILAALDDKLASELVSAAFSFGVDALVEVHDEAEMERALQLDAWMIGINNRSLRTFDTDLRVTERLAERVRLAHGDLAPDERVLVSESGISTHADIQRLQRAGARAFLVGESLMREADVAAATRRLLGH